eukprot:scaffold2522_cov242-Pinguiococcus_pyrenoidosus.AAC.9
MRPHPQGEQHLHPQSAHRSDLVVKDVLRNIHCLDHVQESLDVLGNQIVRHSLLVRQADVLGRPLGGLFARGGPCRRVGLRLNDHAPRQSSVGLACKQGPSSW